MTDDPPMIPTRINDRWTLLLPEHRAARPEWPTWEAVRLASMHANLDSGDVVVDVGAEEGDMPALFQSWVEPPGGVVLIEPNPKVWPNILAIWRANGLRPPVATVAGFACAYDDPAWSGDVPDVTPWPESANGPLIGDHGFCVLHERPDLPRVPLDVLWMTLVEAGRYRGHLDVITVDVEGGELAVLRGAARILTALRPLVYVSEHDDFLPQYGHTTDELVGFMAGCGYRRVVLDEPGHERHVVYVHPDGRPLRDG